MKITLDDLIGEYNKLAKRDFPSGLTTSEINVLTGWNRTKVRDFIRLGITAGTITLTHKNIICIDGTSKRVAAYIIRGKKNGINSRT